MDKKVLIMYFSGVGATKKIAEIIYRSIQEKCTADICSIENTGNCKLSAYDAFIIGTPVYHAAPSSIVMDFFSGIEPLKDTTPAFIYNTRALWSCNTNRILAKKLQEKNIITIIDKSYRSPASDGVLIAPFIQHFYEFDRQIYEKVAKDCECFLKRLEHPAGYIPKFSAGSIFNGPNKMAGQLVTFNIYLHQDHCICCGKCIASCPHHAIQKSNSGYPDFIRKKCENCYRCIHHCPRKALSLSKNKIPSKILQYDKY